MKPVAMAFSARRHAGGRASGAGQLAKMVNQICIAGLVQGCPRASPSARRPGWT
jgi:3-hydroxyisobutyrate dehydrogenase